MEGHQDSSDSSIAQQGEGETTSISSSAWEIPDSETLQEKVQELQKKVLDEEISKKDFQRKVEEAMARKKEAKEEAAVWQDRAEKEGLRLVEAEAASARLQKKVETLELSHKSAERDADDSRRQAEEAAEANRRLKERADKEENLRKYWQQKARNEGSSQVQEDEAVLRVKAEAVAEDWKSIAKREEAARRDAERETQKWMELADQEKLVRQQLERQADMEEGLRAMGIKKAGCQEEDKSCSRIDDATIFNRVVFCLIIFILFFLSVQTVVQAFQAEKDKLHHVQTQLNQSQMHLWKEEALVTLLGQRVVQIGGTGEIRISLEATGNFGGDLYVQPLGDVKKIYYDNKRAGGGVLDNDCYGSKGGSCVENVIFAEPKPGWYHTSVYCEGTAPGWTLTVERGGEKVKRKGACPPHAGTHDEELFFFVESTS